MTEPIETYSLYLAGREDLVQLLQILVVMRYTPPWSRRLNDFGIYTFYATTDTVAFEAQYLIEANPLRAEVEQDLGFLPTKECLFHVDPTHHDVSGEVSGLLTVVRSLSAVLARTDSEAALVGPNRERLLERREKVVINSASPFWSTGLTSHLAMPFQRQDLAAVKRQAS